MKRYVLLIATVVFLIFLYTGYMFGQSIDTSSNFKEESINNNKINE